MERGSASAGERATAAWLAGRLDEIGASDARVQPFRYPKSWAPRHAAHHLAGIAGAARGGTTGAALALAALRSFDRDFSGRSQWLARLLPAGEGANALARIPARGERGRTLVLVAHHDTAQTGLVWRRPGLAGVGTADAVAGLLGRPRPDAIDFLARDVEVGYALAALGAATGMRAPRLVGAATLALATLLALDVARSPSVPGASDNATGVAAVLSLAERFVREPLAGTEVLVVLPGCEEAGMGGMRAWIDAEGVALDPRTTLVLGLDTLGAGEPIVLRGEGRPGAVPYRETDNAWADRGADSEGMPHPRRFKIGGWTDPALAVFAGLPTISMLSVKDGRFTEYHLPTDTPERVDWDCVERCARLAGATCREWSEARQ